MNFNRISIFDTSIATYNSGNKIIMDSVNQEIETIFPKSFLFSLPVEDIKKNARNYNALSDISFLGGTNILNSDIRKYRQWDLSWHNIYRLSGIVLMGCGWFQYETKPTTAYTKWAFHKILSSTYIHSVRDNYTKKRLEEINIRAINTGCPTLWKLSDDVIDKIPTSKQRNVVVTLTDYNKKQERDKHILDTCLKNYQTVYYYPQGLGDIDYLNTIGYTNKLQILSPQLSEFNKVISHANVDYIGTRLHAGIRALQNSTRCFIIGIDNRAIEMGKDFNLPIIKENDIELLNQKIHETYHLNLLIPQKNINEWKEQFRTT